MSKLIDAEKLDFVSYQGIPDGYKDSFDSGVLYAMNLIDEQPTIDAVPVVHGHWIGWSGEKMVDYYNETYKKIHGYRCSNCNRNTAVKSKYCSCCGALMDEVTI